MRLAPAQALRPGAAQTAARLRTRLGPAGAGAAGMPPRAAPGRVLLTNDDGPDSPFFRAWVPFVRASVG